MKLKCLVPLEDISLIMKLLHSIINFFLRMFYFFNYLVTSQGWIFILSLFIVTGCDTQLAFNKSYYFNEYKGYLAVVLWALLQYFFHS